MIRTTRASRPPNCRRVWRRRGGWGRKLMNWRSYDSSVHVSTRGALDTGSSAPVEVLSLMTLLKRVLLDLKRPRKPDSSRKRKLLVRTSASLRRRKNVDPCT